MSLYVRFIRRIEGEEREVSPGRGPFHKIMVDEAELVGYPHSNGEEVVGRYEHEIGWRRVAARLSEGAWDGFEIEEGQKVNRTKYKAETQSIDAGRYRVEITTGEDGSVSAVLTYVNADLGVRTVAVLVGMADPAVDGALVTVMDAYDAGNALRVRY